MERFLFPRWSNKVLPLALVLGVGPISTAAAAGVWYYGTNKHIEVGYTPTQPVDYSHKLHAGDMGMDCRYCHSTVERAGKAAVPTPSICMNCHSTVKKDSDVLLPIREAYAENKPVVWTRVHDLPDYVYFNHEAHVNATVGCESCHGRIDQMVKVFQAKPLTMEWCLECHRNPEPNLRSFENLTKMGYAVPPAERKKVLDDNQVRPPTNCSTCHR